MKGVPLWIKIQIKTKAFREDVYKRQELGKAMSLSGMCVALSAALV